MYKFIEYPDAEMMMIDLANVLVGALEEALLTHDKVSFCVPGGTTPGPIFDAMSAVHLDWARVSVLLSDERWVPLESPRSNTTLIKSRLLTGPAATASLVPLYAPTDTPEDSIEALRASLEPHLPISLLLLGMGTDMHTASLFPGGDALAEALAQNAPPLVAMRAPGANEARVTLSASALSGALDTHVVITGAEKRAALEAAATLPPEQAPIGTVLPHATVHWAP